MKDHNSLPRLGYGTLVTKLSEISYSLISSPAHGFCKIEIAYGHAHVALVDHAHWHFGPRFTKMAFWNNASNGRFSGSKYPAGLRVPLIPSVDTPDTNAKSGGRDRDSDVGQSMCFFRLAYAAVLQQD